MIKDYNNIIPSSIYSRWYTKYGPYLAAYISEDCIIWIENGTLDSFCPSGDLLAVHYRKTNRTLYIWNNTEYLTQNDYLARLTNEK